THVSKKRGIGRSWLRFYFDGVGNIVGSQPASSNSTFLTNVGTYSVSDNCQAKLTLSSGQTFDAVIINHGQSVPFLETDSAGAGTTGTLQEASSCIGLSYPATYGFSFFGATQQAGGGATGATGSTGAT